jgi:hypothetical protein
MRCRELFVCAQHAVYDTRAMLLEQGAGDPILSFDG